jgi:cell division protein FtsB
MKMLSKKKKSFLGRFSFQIVVCCVLVAVFVLGSALSRELYREYQIKKEIDKLKVEIEAMEKDNYELSQLLEYYQTDEYKEAEARQRLNLKGEGEKVVMIENKESGAEEVSDEAQSRKDKSPNHVKWWNYFFASRS